MKIIDVFIPTTEVVVNVRVLNITHEDDETIIAEVDYGFPSSFAVKKPERCWTLVEM